MNERAYGDFVLYRRLLREARPYWPHIAGLFLISLLATPLALLAPVPLKIAVDSVIGSEPVPGFVRQFLPDHLVDGETEALVLAAVLTVAVAALAGAQDIASSLLRAYAGERMVLGFRRKLFSHIQRLSLGYHDERGTADATYRIQYDAPSLQYVAIDGVIPLVTAAVTLVSMLWVVMVLDWQLALVALTISPLLFGASRFYRTKLRTRSREVKRLESSAMGVIQEVLGALRVVKAFGQEEREGERFASRAEDGVAARIRLTVIEGSLGLLIATITAGGTAIVLFVGVRHVQSGTLSLGELLLAMSYLSQLYAPLKTMSRKVASLQSHLAGAERAFSVLDEPSDVPEPAAAIPLGRAAGQVTFREVGFRYSSRGGESDEVIGGPPAVPWTLRDVSFEVPAGARVGITGATGAGKTTLMNLLTRFYDPAEGSILLDGVDLRDYRVADLRSQFSIVLQEPVLFSTSIFENIAYARPNATMTEVRAAARAANIDSFIIQLPDGYRTLVGERGMRLSGGERQRISLARAFLKDAPLLILDEPTSSVDINTEAQIVEAMDRLMAGRTSFMISHRPSTLASCDFMIRVNRGGSEVGPAHPPVTSH